MSHPYREPGVVSPRKPVPPCSMCAGKGYWSLFGPYGIEFRNLCALCFGQGFR